MKEKIITLIFFVGIFLINQAQKNYIVEYDKLSNKTSFFETTFENGKRTSSPISKINLAQGDILKIRIININELVFDTEIIKTATSKPSSNETSPVSAALAALTSFVPGIGALSMLIDISNNQPSKVQGLRGSISEQQKIILSVRKHIYKGYKSLKELIKMVADHEESAKVISSRELSYKQIEKKLLQANEKFSNSEIEDKITELNNIIDSIGELMNIMDTISISTNEYDKESINKNFSKLKNQFSDFKLEYTPDGYFYQENFFSLLNEFYSVDFSQEFTYLAEGPDNGWTPLSNLKSLEYLLVFKDKSSSNIEHSKTLSFPVKEPYGPDWSFGVYLVNSFSGFQNYTVEEFEGDSWLGTPDTLMVSNSTSSYIRPSVGTSLNFDIPSNGKIQPNLMLGASVRFGENESKYINVLLGGGFKFKKLNQLSFSGGLAFCQSSILKEDYSLNKKFVNNLEYYWDGYNYNELFIKTFNPGLFFGISYGF
jgi:hypothetical protein